MAWLMMNLYVYSVGLQQFGEGEQQRWTVEPKVISLSQSVFRGTLVFREWKGRVPRENWIKVLFGCIVTMLQGTWLKD